MGGEELAIIAREFEDILEASPRDQVALESLAFIYEANGDRDRAREYVLRLGQSIALDGDAELAAYILDRMNEYGLCEGEGANLCELISQLMSDQGDVSISSAQNLSDDTLSTFNLMDELAFAWELFEAGELTQDEYSQVANDLSEMASDRHLSTASVLHVLESRAFGGLERLMGFVARSMNVPIITLSAFSIPEEFHTILPREFMIRRGVLVFDTIGDDALAVVMNPVNMELRRHVEALLKCRCHYYIALPSEFDSALARISGNS
jgi:hypothetical protein